MTVCNVMLCTGFVMHWVWCDGVIECDVMECTCTPQNCDTGSQEKFCRESHCSDLAAEHSVLDTSLPIQ